MRKSSCRTNQQGKQVQKTLTLHTRGSPKMADSTAVNTQERTPDTMPKSTLSLRMLWEELQINRETVLVQIKAEIATSETAHEYKEMGTALSETMDRVSALEKSQQLISKECKKMQDKCQDLENRSRRQNLRLISRISSPLCSEPTTSAPRWLLIGLTAHLPRGWPTERDPGPLLSAFTITGTGRRYWIWAKLKDNWHTKETRCTSFQTWARRSAGSAPLSTQWRENSGRPTSRTACSTQPGSLSVWTGLDTPLVPGKLLRISTTRRSPKWTDPYERK